MFNLVLKTFMIRFLRKIKGLKKGKKGFSKLMKISTNLKKKWRRKKELLKSKKLKRRLSRLR